MPEFVLPAEADRCPFCGGVLFDPPQCCERMERAAEHGALCMCAECLDVGVHAPEEIDPNA